MPIVAFRKIIILKAAPYTVNKASYLKQGSKVFKSHKEDLLFENMFEIILTEDYEDNWGYRDQERAISNLKQRQTFLESIGKRSQTGSRSASREKTGDVKQLNLKTEKCRIK